MLAQIGTELILNFGIGPWVKWGPLTDLVYLCGSLAKEPKWACMHLREFLDGTYPRYLHYLSPL